MEQQIRKVALPQNGAGDLGALFGKLDENILKIERAFSVNIVNRGGELAVVGNEPGALAAEAVLKKLAALSVKGFVSEQTVNYIVAAYGSEDFANVENVGDEVICVSYSGKPIKPKTVGQRKYAESIRKNTIVFGVGPAGTGKTYIAMAAAVAAFRKNDAARIILTRPAIEAGESLGFLPGDLQSKVDPYLRPLYDALYDILGADTFTKLTERGAIEVAPLAYMRGRTLDNSFIVLDEAQNTTKEQMKMFLTRIGFGSKAVITGDVTQIDLPANKKSGLIDAVSVLKNIDGIGISMLTNKDVVRHPLVQKIIAAYEKQGTNGKRATRIYRKKP
ncbi:phosphate starvation protein PhoH [Clostridia bacterium]|nr:phosphate starvation protein PhoH [Clostridia bacterium]